MNKKLEEFARLTLKEGLAKLEENHQYIFKKMYSPYDLDKDINQVVDDMPVERLDWAMRQVSRSLEILRPEGEN